MRNLGFSDFLNIFLFRLINNKIKYIMFYCKTITITGCEDFI